MGITPAAQTAYFLWSLVLGLALGILYDAVRAVRMIFRAGRIHVILSDIVFFMLCGVLTSLFALPFNKGNVRVFILFGEGVGFLSYRLTLGSVMGKVYAFCAALLRSFVQKIRKILQLFFDFLLKATAVMLYNINVVIEQLRQTMAQKKKNRRLKRYHKEQHHEKKRYQKTAYRVKKNARQRGGGSRGR